MKVTINTDKLVKNEMKMVLEGFSVKVEPIKTAGYILKVVNEKDLKVRYKKASKRVLKSVDKFLNGFKESFNFCQILLCEITGDFILVGHYVDASGAMFEVKANYTN